MILFLIQIQVYLIQIIRMDNDIKPKELEKIPLIYLYIYKNLIEDTKLFEEVSYRSLISEFSRTIFKIPRKYYDIVIKELIDFKLIEKISFGRSPTYNITHNNYIDAIKELDSLEKSGLRFKILKDKFEKLIKDIEKVESLDQKYKLLRINYEKLLRKLELKKIEGSHYW